MTEAAGFDVVSVVQYGILGVILVLILLGYLWAKPSVDRIIADKKAAEDQRDALVAVYQAQVIPVLAETKDKVVPALNTVTQLLERIARENREDRQELRRAFDAAIRETRGQP